MPFPLAATILSALSGAAGLGLGALGALRLRKAARLFSEAARRASSAAAPAAGRWQAAASAAERLRGIRLSEAVPALERFRGLLYGAPPSVLPEADSVYSWLSADRADPLPAAFPAPPPSPAPLKGVPVRTWAAAGLAGGTACGALAAWGAWRVAAGIPYCPGWAAAGPALLAFGCAAALAGRASGKGARAALAAAEGWERAAAESERALVEAAGTVSLAADVLAEAAGLLNVESGRLAEALGRPEAAGASPAWPGALTAGAAPGGPGALTAGAAPAGPGALTAGVAPAGPGTPTAGAASSENGSLPAVNGGTATGRQDPGGPFAEGIRLAGILNGLMRMVVLDSEGRILPEAEERILLARAAARNEGG